MNIYLGLFLYYLWKNLLFFARNIEKSKVKMFYIWVQKLYILVKNILLIQLTVVCSMYGFHEIRAFKTFCLEVIQKQFKK
jgi:hypothetical protein